MALDAICLQSVVRELKSQIVGARIEKIQQPARDQIVLLLRGSRRLLVCAGVGQPRLHLTRLLRDNPSQPPMFCMLLRKYLAGGRIAALRQAELERVVELEIEALDELGEQSRFRLILEAMGRRSNLILCAADGHIIDCLRRVDFEMSQERQVLPGLFYHLPPAQDKRSPLAAEREEFLELLAQAPAEQALDRWLLDTYTAISPLVARELVYRACGATDARRSGNENALWESFSAWQSAVRAQNFLPVLLRRDGKPADFTYGPVFQYEGAMEQETAESFSQLLDDFYAGREQSDRVRQKGQDLLKTATSARDRVRRKLAAQEKEYAQTQSREQLRLCGELITANFYRMERGMTKLTAENYYEEGCPQLEIRLDPLLTPQQNAARYYKNYTKAKTAETMLTLQLEKGAQEAAYLDSVLDSVSRAEGDRDLEEIRQELVETGYLRRRAKAKDRMKRPGAKPLEFRSTAGLRISVGRNNLQNDRLTTKQAGKWDYWFHTQKIHGAHVILWTEGRQPDDQSLREAAALAAWFSQGREGKKVPVDYTPVKYVKKPAGARPGMVVYTTYQTAYVDPDPALADTLRA